MKLSSSDRLHLFKVGAQAFGYIVFVVGVVAFILAAYYLGVKSERRRSKNKLGTAFYIQSPLPNITIP